jgi:hypothetical protein
VGRRKKMQLKQKIKQSKFVEEYLKEPNASKAMRIINPKLTEGSSWVEGHRMLSNANVKNEIELALQGAGMSNSWLAKEIVKTYSEAKYPRDKATLLRLMADIKGLTKQDRILLQQSSLFAGLDNTDVAALKEKVATVADVIAVVEEDRKAEKTILGKP